MAGKKGKGGQAPSKPKTRKGGKRSRAESDRPTAHDLDRGSDAARPGADEVPNAEPDAVLTPLERRLARVLALEPEVPMWRAGWLAGYCGGDPSLPEPQDNRTRDKLAKSATKARGRLRVQAEIDRLRSLSARGVRARAALGDAEAKVEAEARERRLDALTAEHDVVQIGADLLQLKLNATFADVGEFVEWEGVEHDGVVLKGSDDLTKDQRRCIQKVQFHPRCGACGADHEKPGFSLELVPKATFSAQATKHLGLEAPRKHEVSGANGGPIEHSVVVEEAPDVDLLELCASELLGVVPASVSEQERGLAPDEVIAILKGWASDSEPHVGAVHELFEEAHLEESKARYLGDD